MTLAKKGQDYYDVEVINGVNIPVSMSPTNTPGGSSYKCGNPGSKFPRTKIGACDWNLKAPLVENYQTTPEGNPCNTNSDCSGGNICGLSFNPGFAQLLRKTCGRFLGYWTANEICGVQQNYGAPFNC